MEGEKIFKTSFLGFNKEDVIEYIAQMKNEYAKKMEYENKYLNREINRLKEKIKELEARDEVAPVAVKPDNEDVERLRMLNEMSGCQEDLSQKVARLLSDNEQIKKEMAILKEKTNLYTKQNHIKVMIKDSETLLEEAKQEADKIRSDVNDYVSVLKDEFENSRAKLFIAIQNRISQDQEEEAPRKNYYAEAAQKIVENMENNVM